MSESKKRGRPRKIKPDTKNFVMLAPDGGGLPWTVSGTEELCIRKLVHGSAFLWDHAQKNGYRVVVFLGKG